MIPSLYDIGSGWCFRCYINDSDFTFERLQDLILKDKRSAILISDMFGLPFMVGECTVILFHCFSRNAYDLYHKLNGKHLRVVDPVIIQSILLSVASDKDIKKPTVICLDRPYI